MVVLWFSGVFKGSTVFREIAFVLEKLRGDGQIEQAIDTITVKRN